LETKSKKNKIVNNTNFIKIPKNESEKSAKNVPYNEPRRADKGRPMKVP